MSQDEVEDAVQVCLTVVELDAVSRQVDRRLEQLAPGERSERAVGVLKAHRGARDRAGWGSDVEDLRRPAAEVHVNAVHVGELAVRQTETRDGDEEVEDAGRAVTGTVDEHEAARTGAGERTFRDPGDERRRDGCVDCIAPGFEHASARLRGQRVAGGNCPFHAGRLARISAGSLSPHGP